MSYHLHAQMEKVKNRLLTLAIMVEEQLVAAVKAVMSQEQSLAKDVIKKDLEIDKKEIEIEEECLKILALYQPVAKDLRFMVGVLKINNDLERIGDLAKSIAKKVPFRSGQEILPGIDFTEMSSTCWELFRMSIDSMIHNDIGKALEVCAKDDIVDDMNLAVRNVVIEQIAKDPEHSDIWLKKMSIARDLERIADHATNIAEDVIYMINGEIARHGA
jgi:phosphate transport system protein